MALMLSLLAAIVLAPPQPGATDRDWPVGLEFNDSIPQRDREPLRDSFSRTLPLACEQTTPCVENCSDDSPTVGVELDGSDRNYTLRWVATDPRLDDPLVVQSSCELCSLVELEQQIATDLTRVCSQLDALDAGPGQLVVSSDPHGASVRVDGQKVGRTPWSGELTAGEHRIELRRIGHLPQRHSVAIVGNVETRQHFSLTSSFARRGRPTWPAWTTMGLGIAMAVAGTALISVHGQPWAGRCTGADVDAAGNCRFVLTTRPLGITLAILGTGAIASGVGLMIWAQRDPAQSSAGVTLSGRF
jgi:hypothetical protein